MSRSPSLSSQVISGLAALGQLPSNITTQHAEQFVASNPELVEKVRGLTVAARSRLRSAVKAVGVCDECIAVIIPKMAGRPRIKPEPVPELVPEPAKPTALEALLDIVREFQERLQMYAAAYDHE